MKAAKRAAGKAQRALGETGGTQAREAIKGYIAGLEERRFKSVVAQCLRNSPEEYVRRFFEAANEERSPRDAFASVLTSDFSAVEYLPPVEKRRLLDHLPKQRPATNPQLSLRTLALAACVIVIAIAGAALFVVLNRVEPQRIQRAPINAQRIVVRHRAPPSRIAIHAPPRAAPRPTQLRPTAITVAAQTRPAPVLKHYIHTSRPASEAARLPLQKHTRSLSSSSSAAAPAPPATAIAQTQAPDAFAAGVVRSSDPQAVVQNASIVSRNDDAIVVEVTSAQDGSTETDRLTLRPNADTYQVVTVERIASSSGSSGANRLCYARGGWYPCSR